MNCLFHGPENTLENSARSSIGSMIGFAVLLPWLVFSSTANGAENPSAVASINLCTDQLLLMLAEPGQIASVSYLALEPASSFMAEAANRYTINHARIEELLALQPDLILAGEFPPPNLVKLLRRLGYRVEQFPIAASVDDIRHNIRRLARLLGAGRLGEQLIRNMDRRLRQSAETQPHDHSKALFLQPRGYTSGRNTLQDEALELAGWRNLAADQGIEGYGPIDLESLILADPQRIFTSRYAPGTHSLAQRLLNHPALQRLTAGRPILDIDYRYWICGGPMITDAVEALSAAHPQ